MAASIKISLRKNISWSAAGNVVYAGSQWGILVTLAKLGSLEMVGQFALGLAVTAPVMMFCSLNLRDVLASDSGHQYSFSDYFRLRVGTTVLGVIIIAAIVPIAGYQLQTAMTILAVGIAKAVEEISDIFYGLFQARERMDRVAKSLMIRGPLSLVSLAIIVFLTQNIFWGVMGLVSVWVMVLLGYDFLIAYRGEKYSMAIEKGLVDYSKQVRGISTPWKMKTLVNLAWLTFPLGITLFLGSLHSNIPRYFVERHLGESMLGIFAALAYFERAGFVVVHAMGRSATPQLSRLYLEKNYRAYRSLLFKLIGIGGFIGLSGVVAAMVGGRELVSLLYRPEYAKQDVFIILMAGGGVRFVSSLFLYGATVARYINCQFFLLGLETLVLFISCYELIPGKGLLGAALAMFVARSVEAAGGLMITLHSTVGNRKGKGGIIS